MAESTASYYRNNDAARKKRLVQQRAYNKTEKGSEIRKNANKLIKR